MHAEHAVQTLSYILALGFLRQVFTCSSGWPWTWDPLVSTSGGLDLYKYASPCLAL
jgi:hypothetical protein